MFLTTKRRVCVCLLLQDLVQSCLRGGGKGQKRQRLSGLAAGESADLAAEERAPRESSEAAAGRRLGVGSRLRGPCGKGVYVCTYL
jgi:hypothetical protein